MPSGVARIFRYRCPLCNYLNVSKCAKCGAIYKLGPQNAPGEKWLQQRIKFGERQWERIKARSAMSRMAPTEFVRMAVEDALWSTPHRMLSSD
jgi:hypothetical protein